MPSNHAVKRRGKRPCDNRWNCCYASPVRWLVYSDVHGNREALQAVWEMAGERCDGSLCLGDVVGYGAHPNETAEWVRQHSVVTVRGNHDRVCAQGNGSEGFNAVARAAALWTHEQLRPENLEWLLRLPTGPMDHQGLRLAHGSPEDEDEYILASYQAARLLGGNGPQVTLIGHTHVQCGWERGPEGEVRPLLLPRAPEIWTALSAGKAPVLRQTVALRKSCRYLINPGAVGQPRDRDWRAACLLLQDDPAEVTFLRVPYDLEAAREAILAAGLPVSLGARLERGQ